VGSTCRWQEGEKRRGEVEWAGWANWAERRDVGRRGKEKREREKKRAWVGLERGRGKERERWRWTVPFSFLFFLLFFFLKGVTKINCSYSSMEEAYVYHKIREVRRDDECQLCRRVNFLLRMGTLGTLRRN
jgi:hypothetical protein